VWVFKTREKRCWFQLLAANGKEHIKKRKMLYGEPEEKRKREDLVAQTLLACFATLPSLAISSEKAKLDRR